MTLFGLIKDKCFYCRKPINRGDEISSEVKVIGYVGTFKKKFCSEEHITTYNNEIQNKPKGSGGSCCG